MKIIAGTGITISLMLGFGFFLYNSSHLNARFSTTEATSSTDKISKPLSDTEKMQQMDEVLSVLMSIHYVSLTDREDNGPEAIILDEMTESMNDLNKLKNLNFQAESISNSENEIIATTGLALKAVITKLIATNEVWIAYLRGVDINDINVSEFQYQLATNRTESHDAYLLLAQGVSMMPMLTVEFAEKEGEGNKVHEVLKSHFLQKIDSLFSDILVTDDQFYKETKTQNVVPVIIRQYKKFFE